MNKLWAAAQESAAADWSLSLQEVSEECWVDELVSREGGVAGRQRACDRAWPRGEGMRK